MREWIDPMMADMFQETYAEMNSRCCEEFRLLLKRFCTIPDDRIEKVIFNRPATIVIWADGTKTVVKCQEGDIFDREKGLAMAISKHAFGNKGDYYDVFKKYVPNQEHTDDDVLEVEKAYLTADCMTNQIIDMALNGSSQDELRQTLDHFKEALDRLKNVDKHRKWSGLGKIVKGID